MKLKIVLQSVILVLIFLQGSLAQTKDCNDSETWLQATHASSAAECKAQLNRFAKTCDEGTSDSTSGYVNRTMAEDNCLRNIANKELDKRLFQLKKEKPAEFKMEMKLQKNFNLAQMQICNELNACDGTMYRLTRASCILALTNWRLDQILQVNSKKLSLQYSAKKSANVHPSKELKKFAELLCQMSPEVFLTKSSLAECKDSVQKSFLLAAGPLCD